jgi:hypothetical protein
MTNLPNFKDYCEAACIKLWGEPDKRSKKELRWENGDAYSARTYSIRKKAWYDHGQERGGSTLDLVDYAKGRPKRDLRGSVFFEVWREANAMGVVPDPAPEPTTNGGGKPIIASYPYNDEQGALLFEVVRFDTSDVKERFRQRRPDGRGGWIWNVKGIRQVLYRLPELIAAVKAGERVLVTEGEKDANTAVKLGYVATTMPGGVGKWRDSYARLFAGADVVVVSDNDANGKGVKVILEKSIEASNLRRPQSVQYRAKSPESLKVRLEEIGRLDSQNIENERRDIAGVRIIFYTNTDVERFRNSRLIFENFEIERDATATRQWRKSPIA